MDHKNSWGNKEEDKGYTYISYEDRSMCEFLSGQFVKSSTYKYNYFYDGSANPSAYRLKKGQQIANIYTAKKEQRRKRDAKSSQCSYNESKCKIQHSDL